VLNGNIKSVIVIMNSHYGGICVRDGNVEEIFSKAGCILPPDQDSSEIGVAMKMESHILTCLGALIEIQNERRRLGFENFLFFKSVIAVCNAAIDKFSDNGEDFALKLVPLAENDIAIALACQKFRHANILPPFEHLITPEDDDYSKLSLHWAAVVDNLDINAFAKALKCHGNNVALTTFPVGKLSVAHVASATRRNNIQVLERIREVCPNFAQLRDSFGNCPLHYAAQYTNSVEMLHYLIDADPTALLVQGCYGQTPMHLLACRNEDGEDVLGLLVCILTHPLGLQSLITQDFKGNTPLHNACAQSMLRDNIKILRQLLLASPDVVLKLKNSDGHSPIAEVLSDDPCTKNTGF
jgi:hypothetical protein